MGRRGKQEEPLGKEKEPQGKQLPCDKSAFSRSCAFSGSKLKIVFEYLRMAALGRTDAFAAFRDKPRGFSTERNLIFDMFILRCNISWIVLDFVHATLSAYDDRSSTQDTLAKSLALKRPTMAQAHPYVAAAAATVGALAISAFVNRHLARMRNTTIPPPVNSWK